MSKLSLPDRAALWHAFFLFQILLPRHRHDFPHVAGVRSFTAKLTRLQTPANTPPDPCRQHAARPLQTRRCQTPADKTLPDPCRQDSARPLQTRLCQTPADKTLPDPCRQDAAARQALRCRPAPRHARHYRPLHCALRHRYHKFAEKFYNNYWSRDALHTTA